MNGDWQLDNPNWNFSGIEFEQFTIITQGYFSLITNGPPIQAANFPVSISNIGFGVLAGDIVLGAEIGLNFGDPDKPTFSAETAVKVFTNIERNPSTNKIQWQYDHFALSTDPVYGKGFYGGVAFRLPNIMDNSISMACAFGRIGGNSGYRYWMIDVTAPTNIPVGSSSITSITGGIAYHMINTIIRIIIIDKTRIVEIVLMLPYI